MATSKNHLAAAVPMPSYFQKRDFFKAFKKTFIYLAVPGLSCSIRDLVS